MVRRRFAPSRHSLLAAAATALSFLVAGRLDAQEAVLAARAATAATPVGSPERLAKLLAEASILLRYELAATTPLLDEAHRLAGELGDREGEARTLVLTARSKAKIEGPLAARQVLQAAELLLGPGASPRTRAEVDFAFAVVDWTLDDVPQSLVRLRSALENAEDAGEPGLLAQCRLLAFSVIDFPEDPLAAVDLLETGFRKAGLAHGLLEARMMRAHAQRRLGQATDDGDFRALLDDAARLGVRTIESYVARVLGATSRNQPDVALAYGQRSVTVARALGDREVLGMALQHLAETELLLGRPTDARTTIAASLAAFSGMGMAVRERDALATAARIATTSGDTDAARSHGERLLALEREMAARSSDDVRARFWRESTNLRTEMRSAQRAHQSELAVLGARLDTILWTSALLVVAVGCLLSTFLFRAKRRLESTNVRLTAEMANAQRLQTEREALERNLRQMERLDSLGLLAGGFAHDFNNLLVSVKGNAQLLQAELAPADRGRILQDILGASDRAAALCKDILGYARSGNGERAVVDARTIVQAVVPIARAGLGAAVAVETDLGNDALWIDADRTQIEQVVLNMLSNAGDALRGRPHGRVSITVEPRRLGEKPPAGHWFGEFQGGPRDCVAIVLADDGEGMAEDTIRRIFDPFFSTRFPGRGIGLAAAYGILRRHGGVVHVESEVGRGSTFSVYLPKATPGSTSASSYVDVVEPLAMAPGPTATNGGTVLVVDDEPSVLRTAARLLHQIGLRAVLADSATAVRAELAAHGPTLRAALLDFTMPGTDGAELTALIRERMPHLPIVIMSGHDEASVRAALPDCSFLQKPFGADELHRAVQVALAAQV